MITRDQASLVGDALVQQARDEELARKNAAAATVPYMYRFPELEALERWERPILVAEARRYAMRQPKVIALWVVLSALTLCMAVALVVADLPLPLFGVWLCAMVLVAPAYFYRREVMRAHIRAKIAALVSREARDNKDA